MHRAATRGIMLPVSKDTQVGVSMDSIRSSEKGDEINKRKKIAELRKLERRVDDINDMFRPPLEDIDLDTHDDVEISTAIYELTGGLRSAIIEARQSLQES